MDPQTQPLSPPASPPASAPPALPSSASSTPPSTTSSASSTPPSPTPSQQTPAGFDFGWVPQNFKGKAEDFGKHYNEIMTRVSADDVRRNMLPATPESYQVKTSKDFKLPEGAQFTVDANNPLWAQFKTWAHSNHLSQEATEQVVDLLAAYQHGEATTIRTAINAEIAKLGPNGPNRITALQTWFNAKVGADDAKLLSQALITARHVEAFERLVSKDVSGGAAPFSQSHREPAQGNGKVSDEEYAKMTPAQRWNYSRSFDQSKFQR